MRDVVMADVFNKWVSSNLKLSHQSGARFINQERVDP
jgi:hypothetical protein